MSANIYIDGTNLLAGLVELYGVKKVPKFKNVLKEVYKLHKVNKIYFYASYTSSKYIRNKNVKQYIELEKVFFNQAKNARNLVFYKGYRSPTSKKEKGVDVHLAVDLVKDAVFKKYSKAIIFSGDADLAYPVEIVRSLGYPVFSVFLPNRFSPAIAFQSFSPTVLNYKSNFRPESLKTKIKKLKVVQIKDPA